VSECGIDEPLVTDIDEVPVWNIEEVAIVADDDNPVVAGFAVELTRVWLVSVCGVVDVTALVPCEVSVCTDD
jgi:hypothetical protein